MPIPDFQSFMLPLLQFASDRQEHALSDAVDNLSAKFQLTPAERSALLPSGRQTIVENRVGWARTFMKKAGLFEYPRRGHFMITPRGKEILSEGVKRVDNQLLSRFPEFVEFRKLRHDDVPTEVLAQTSEITTPEENIEQSHAQIQNALASEVLARVKSCSPAFFERLVVDVLVKMGYGGSRRDAGRAVGQSGDGGIDGIIDEDRLGLDVIYLQAKRWENVVGRPEIQKFVGALQGHRARKGVFITTSNFTKDAQEYVGKIDTKIVLIDGERLAELMLDHGVGVTQQAVYEIKRIDSDYFIEE